MAATLESLVIKRKRIKSQVTRFETVLNKIKDDTDLVALDLEGRLFRYNELWNIFDQVQTNIEEMLPTIEDDSCHELERTAFEDRFYAISGTAKKYIQKMSHSLSISSAQSTSTAHEHFSQDSFPNQHTFNQNSGQTPIHFSSHFQLPKLPKPTFHGTFDTWLAFYDSFRSMYHDNPHIPTINKFMYLREFLQGEAAEVIASLATTSDNYTIAWELLKNRYDNKKFIVESHIKALFEIPTISREFPIRRLLDNVQKQIRALKTLGQPVDHWDILLIFIIKKKLDDLTRDKWEERASTSDIPTMKDFTSFLEQRSLFESLQLSKSVVNSRRKGKSLFLTDSN